MSGKPAARQGDQHECPAEVPGLGLDHTGGPILPPNATKTEIGGAAAARLGDSADCQWTVLNATIVEGAMPVPIGGSPAARKTDATSHGGKVLQGEPTVLIGLAGTTGNVYAGKLACQNAAAGRTSGSTSQSYNNCGVESSRQLINHATDADVSEDALLQQAIDNGWAADKAGDGTIQRPDGGTSASDRINILGANGVAAETVVNPQAEAFELALSNGQGAIVALDAAALWPTTAPNVGAMPAGSWHAVQVTGITYDDNGDIVEYTLNDTGTGQCGVVVDKATFDTATNAYTWQNETVVTSNPIW